MPVVQCSSCHARYKVGLDKTNKVLKCAKCGERFEAIALRAAQAKAYGMPPMGYVAIFGGCLVVGLIGYLATRSNEPAALPPTTTPTATPETPAPVARTPTAVDSKELLRKRANDVIQTMRKGDDETLALLYVDFSGMFDDRAKKGLETGTWTALSELDQYAKKDEYLKLLRGEGPELELLKRAVVKDVELPVFDGSSAMVRLQLADAVTQCTQDWTMAFQSVGSNWKLFGVTRGAIVDPAAEGKTPLAELAAATAGKPRRNPEGTVEKVELIEGTSPSTTSSIETHVRTLTDPAATTAASKARTALVGIGKPAIPHLLNELVGLDLKSETDLQKANKLSLALMELSGRDWLIVPGMNAGSMTGESAGDNEQMRRLWFGWWRDVKGTYSGPPTLELTKDEQDQLDKAAKKKKAGKSTVEDP